MPDKLNYIKIQVFLCTINISSYHGAEATLKDNILSFDKTLPSLPIDQLKNDTAISFKMRKLTNKDLMDENILPIFYKDKIALLCVKESVILTVNSQSVFCNSYTLQFHDIPKTLIHRNKSLLLRNKEHHFITDIDLKPSKIFVENFRQQEIPNAHWDSITDTIRK